MINKYSSNNCAEVYSFSNFVAIDSNETAKTTALEFAQTKTSYNVLGISSLIGNGASHLAFAILNQIEGIDNEKEVFYTTFERIHHNKTEFNELTIFNRDFLNTKSLILIDSFYQSSNTALNNRLFEVLKMVNTKMIFTYNKGIKVPIVQKEINLIIPSKIEKACIMKNMLTKLKINLSSDTIDYISDHINLSAREAQGLLICLISLKEQGDLTPEIQLVDNLLQKIL